MDRLEILRNKMYEEGYDVVVIPHSDFHQSEYSSEYFGIVEYFSGFSGSNGTLVVSAEDAVLYTDGRYFIQAQKEIEKTGFRLMKESDPDTPDIFEYIKGLVFDDATVAFDGRVVSAEFGIKLRKLLDDNVHINCEFDPAEFLWEDRPALPSSKVWILDEKYAGESVSSKLSRIREYMKKKRVAVHVLSSLDDIAWILNIRGGDVAFTPVVMAYMVIEDGVVLLYSDVSKFSDEVKSYLDENGIILCEYDNFYNELDNFNNERVLIDVSKINYYMYLKLSMDNECIDESNPSMHMKAIKNETELENLRRVHIKDGLAFTRFFLWLKENVGRIEITEYDAALKMHEFRTMGEGFIEESFETISAYRANAAMMHYTCDAEHAAILNPSDMLLVDSGGHYYEGTTDVTRTIALGPVGDEEKKMFTLVLKGMLNLTYARFIKGCTGINLDILARSPLWEEGIDYMCGTGHGVSYLLGVHEGPNSIRWRRRAGDCIFVPGMVTSNEPGVYVSGRYGIRTENEIVCVEGPTNEYGTFLQFETLTLVPIDTDLVDKNYLSPIDIERLNQYNQKVYDVLLPYFDENDRFLFEKYVKNIH